jgi:aminoglycoside 6-adenylyltransferase
MRSEQEIYDLILSTAREDERVRAVILNGSRANPNARRDPFQDFDVVYVVTESASFRRDLGWIDVLGERMILQLPDEMGETPAAEDEPFGYLMQFADGNRIDLGLWPLARLGELGRDSLSVLLLDKDGLIEPFPPPSEADYLPRPPTAKQFTDCCNEFWWVCPYVAKGLWREEIVYARYMLDEVVREKLRQMLEWYAGAGSGWQRGPGKFGKHLDECLEPELWALHLKTYARADYEETWEALLAMGCLFRTAAQAVAGALGFDYPQGDDERVSAHLVHVRALPRDATEIYE